MEDWMLAPVNCKTTKFELSEKRIPSFGFARHLYILQFVLINLLNSFRLAKMDSMTMAKMIDEANCDESVKKVLKLVMKDDLIKKQGEDIIQLKNEVTDLERRVTDQERYNSEDCLILENAPLNFSNLTASVVNFFSQYLKFRMNTGDIKACHPLSKGNSIYPPSVIVNFI